MSRLRSTRHKVAVTLAGATAGFVLALVAQWWVMRRPEVPKAHRYPDPALVVANPQQLELGDVWGPALKKVAVRLRNRSPRTVQVTGFLRSCACLRVVPSSATLHPGREQTFEVEVDTSRLLSRSADGQPFEVYLGALTDDETHPEIPIRIAGRLRKAVDIHPGYEVDFGRHRGPKQVSERLTVVPRIPVDRLVLGVDPTMDVRAEPDVVTEVRPGQPVHVTLTWDVPKVDQQSEMHGVLSVRLLGPASVPAVCVQLRGVARGLVEVFPARLDLGAVPVGGTLRWEWTIRKPQWVTVLDVDVKPVADGLPCTWELRHVGSLTAIAGQIVVGRRGRDSARYRITLRLGVSEPGQRSAPREVTVAEMVRVAWHGLTPAQNRSEKSKRNVPQP